MEKTIKGKKIFCPCCGGEFTLDYPVTAHGEIQSRSFNDAKKFFRKNITHKWSKKTMVFDILNKKCKQHLAEPNRVRVS